MGALRDFIAPAPQGAPDTTGTPAYKPTSIDRYLPIISGLGAALSGPVVTGNEPFGRALLGYAQGLQQQRKLTDVEQRPYVDAAMARQQAVAQADLLAKQRSNMAASFRAQADSLPEGDPRKPQLYDLATSYEATGSPAGYVATHPKPTTKAQDDLTSARTQQALSTAEKNEALATRGPTASTEQERAKTNAQKAYRSLFTQAQKNDPTLFDMTVDQFAQTERGKASAEYLERTTGVPRKFYAPGAEGGPVTETMFDTRARSFSPAFRSALTRGSPQAGAALADIETRIQTDKPVSSTEILATFGPLIGDEAAKELAAAIRDAMTNPGTTPAP